MHDLVTALLVVACAVVAVALILPVLPYVLFLAGLYELAQPGQALVGIGLVFAAAVCLHWQENR